MSINLRGKVAQYWPLLTVVNPQEDPAFYDLIHLIIEWIKWLKYCLMSDFMDLSAIAKIFLLVPEQRCK